MVFLAVIINAAALSAELSFGRFDLNDSVFHYTMADRMAQAVERGENPFDFWVSEWTFGYPVSRTYQPLGHAITAGMYIALAKVISLATLFAWIRYLLVVLLPVTVYVAARQFRMTPMAAAAAALISPLISTNGLFGIEYGSYLWNGSGLFTQALSMHLLLLTMGSTFKSMRAEGKGIAAGALLGLTFLSHFIFGYIGALTACLIAVIPNTLPLAQRMRRLLIVASVALCLSAFELAPTLVDSPLINHSRWEPAWKWDSFGAAQVMRQLVTGDLIDFGRFPVLSLLVLLGAAVCVHGSRSVSKTPPEMPLSTYRVLLGGSILWLLLYFGRPAWGGFFNMFAPGDIQLHRLIAGVHLFFILMGGIAIATIWQSVYARQFDSKNVVLIAMTVVIISPAVRERREWLARSRRLGESNVAAFQAEQTSIDELTSKISNVPGRVYPGMAAGWGKDFRVGSVPIYALLSMHHIPAVAFLYHAMALTSDIMVLFDEQNADHYNLFNVSTVVSDGRPMPSFVHETESIGRFHLGSAPGGGYFAIVRAPYSVKVDKRSFYDVTAGWLQSNWWANRTTLLLDFDGTVPGSVQRLTIGEQLPAIAPQPASGVVETEQRVNETYNAVVKMDSNAYILFKMTYHPNWKALIDGVPAPTVMLTPGFIGVPVGPGAYRIELRYSPGAGSFVLLLTGMAFLGLIIAVVLKTETERNHATAI